MFPKLSLVLRIPRSKVLALVAGASGIRTLNNPVNGRTKVNERKSFSGPRGKPSLLL